MKAKKYSRHPKKPKPNLKGPYSVEPKSTPEGRLTDEEESKPSKKDDKQDPAVIDRQE
jgi:hypothetical protein